MSIWNPAITETVYPFNPSLMAETTVLAYISSSYAGTNLLDPQTQFYAGVANGDVSGPAVVVACNGATEVVFQSRVYRFNLDVSCRMIAADSQTGPNIISSAMSLSGQVYALFGDDQTACVQMNTLQTGLASIQCQVLGYANERIEDAWISNLNLTLVAVPVAQ